MSPNAEEELERPIKKIIKSGYWQAPENGPLVLKWAINIGDQLIANAIEGNNPPELDVPHTDGVVRLASLVNSIRKYMATATAFLEKHINIKFVEVGKFAETFADFTIKILDLIPRESEGVTQGQVSGFPFFNGDVPLDVTFRKDLFESAMNSEFIARHELGHLLGLKHPWDGSLHRPYDSVANQQAKTEVIYTIMGYNVTVAEWTADDLKALKFLYGAVGERPVVQTGQKGGPQPTSQPNTISDRKPSFFDFTEVGNGEVLNRKLSVLVGILDNPVSSKKSIQVMIFDDGRGQNKIKLATPVNYLKPGELSGTGAFKFGNVEILSEFLSYSANPVVHQIVLEATGSGRVLPALELELLTYRITGTGQARTSMGVEHNSGSAAFKWYFLRGGEEFLVSQNASFKPIEPGTYRLDLTLGELTSSFERKVFWASESENVIKTGSCTKGDDYIHLNRFGGSYGGGGNDYIYAGNLSERLEGEPGEDVLVAGTKKTIMLGGSGYRRDSDANVFLVYQGLSHFDNRAHIIDDFAPDNDKIWLGYAITKVWYKETTKGIYLLNAASEDALIYVFIPYKTRYTGAENSTGITNIDQLKTAHFDVMGQPVTLYEYHPDLWSANDLHHWVVTNLKDEKLVTLGRRDFNEYPRGNSDDERAEARLSDKNYDRLIDLGKARQVWFDVEDVDGDGENDTVLYKTANRSEIFGVLNDYDARVADPWNRLLDVDFFVDNTIEVIDLDII
jgi:hypothetical protein